MKKNKKTILYSIIVILAVCTIIAISYAIYTFAPESYALSTNTTIPSCASVEILEAQTITLSGDLAAPISDKKALGSTNYRYTIRIRNNCTSDATTTLALAPGANNTMPMEAVKYAVTLTTASTGSYVVNSSSVKRLNNQIKEEIKKVTGDTVNLGYELYTDTIPAGYTLEGYLYIWIDEDEGGLGNNATMNKRLDAHVIISNYESIGSTPTLASQVTSLVGTEETNADGAWSVVNDHGIRYIGTNPDNYIDIGDVYQTDMYDVYIAEYGIYLSLLLNVLPVPSLNACNTLLASVAEDLAEDNLTATCQKRYSAGDPILWRIIGVFEEQYDTNNDNIPDTTGNLVKVIRKDAIAPFTPSFDGKNTGVGSSTLNSGSNDWSDSQLMMMLNPPEFYKSGYDANGNQIHSDYTITTGTNTNSIYDSNGVLIYKNMGAYWNANMTAYGPDQTTTSGFTSTDTVSLATLSSSAQSKIATVKWHLGGIDNEDIATYTASDFYTAERGTNVYTGRPVYWYGKIGLPYTSDYGYATSERASCNNLAIASQTSSCSDANYLFYSNFAGMGNMLLIDPLTNGYDIMAYGEDGLAVERSGSDFISYIFPTFYLKYNVVFSGGSGTENDPYKIVV